MYAELVVQTERSLPRDVGAALREQWGPGVAPSAAVVLSALDDNYGWTSTVRYAQITSSGVYLVFTPDTRTMKIHVESTTQKSHIRVLRALVDEETRRVQTLLERYDNAAVRFTVHLFAEDDHLQTGSMLPAGERILADLRANLLSNVYVPLSAFFLSLMLRYETKQALYNVGAALLALFAWVIGAAVFTRSGYQYREEA